MKSEIVEFDQYAENYDAAFVHLSWAGERQKILLPDESNGWPQLKKIGEAPNM